MRYFVAQPELQTFLEILSQVQVIINYTTRTYFIRESNVWKMLSNVYSSLNRWSKNGWSISRVLAPSSRWSFARISKGHGCTKWLSNYNLQLKGDGQVCELSKPISGIQATIYCCNTYFFLVVYNKTVFHGELKHHWHLYLLTQDEMSDLIALNLRLIFCKPTFIPLNWQLNVFIYGSWL
jgi:hypothetical protein